MQTRSPIWLPCTRTRGMSPRPTSTTLKPSLKENHNEALPTFHTKLHLCDWRTTRLSRAGADHGGAAGGDSGGGASAAFHAIAYPMSNSELLNVAKPRRKLECVGLVETHFTFRPAQEYPLKIGYVSGTSEPSYNAPYAGVFGCMRQIRDFSRHVGVECAEKEGGGLRSTLRTFPSCTLKFIN